MAPLSVVPHPLWSASLPSVLPSLKFALLFFSSLRLSNQPVTDTTSRLGLHNALWRTPKPTATVAGQSMRMGCPFGSRHE